MERWSISRTSGLPSGCADDQVRRRPRVLASELTPDRICVLADLGNVRESAIVEGGLHRRSNDRDLPTRQRHRPTPELGVDRDLFHRVDGPVGDTRVEQDCLQLVRAIPGEAGVAMILAVDEVMDMARSAINVTGNAIASVVVATSEGVFGRGDEELPLTGQSAEQN